jgi:hypothetical protein
MCLIRGAVFWMAGALRFWVTRTPSQAGCVLTLRNVYYRSLAGIRTIFSADFVLGGAKLTQQN